MKDADGRKKTFNRLMMRVWGFVARGGLELLVVNFDQWKLKKAFEADDNSEHRLSRTQSSGIPVQHSTFYRNCIAPESHKLCSTLLSLQETRKALRPRVNCRRQPIKPSARHHSKIRIFRKALLSLSPDEAQSGRHFTQRCESNNNLIITRRFTSLVR